MPVKLEDVHLTQVLNYLKAYKPEVGLLMNFGHKSLTFKGSCNNMQSMKSGNPFKSPSERLSQAEPCPPKPLEGGKRVYY